MPASIRKAPTSAAKQPLRRKVRSELKAIDTAFKRVSRNSAAAIRFLSKAGIATKNGRLAPEYR